jgi:undecaprenyl-diphosphatase
MRGVLHPRGMLLLMVGFFTALTLSVLLGGIVHTADAAARDALLGLATPPVVRVMRVITQLGAVTFLAPAMLALFVVFPEARARWWVWIALMLCAGIAEQTLKVSIARPRPFAASFGFPSGHATASAAFFGAVIYLAGALRPAARVALRIAAPVAIVLVGLSRVMLRAHWPSDVLGGIALGLALASAAALLGRPPRPVHG